jgi:uncharacterized protein YegL
LGKHSNLRLRALLSPYTDFVVHPMRTPKDSLSVSPLERYGPRPAQHTYSSDPRDAARFRNLRLDPPFESPEDAARFGLLPIEQIPEVVSIPSGQSVKGEKNILIVLWDSSGSMMGERAAFVEDYLKALIDRAASNDGKHMETIVYFIPFGSEVGTPIEIKSAEDAQAAIASSNLFGNSGSGTAIGASLAYVPTFIETRFEKDPQLRRSAKKITTVIFTDGEDDVNAAEVKKSFAKLKRGRELLLAYVATGGINDSLFSLTANPQTSGHAGGVFFHWSDSEISNILSESQKRPKPVEGAFWKDPTRPTTDRQLQKALETSRGLFNHTGNLFLNSHQYKSIVSQFQNRLRAAVLLPRAKLRPQSRHNELYTLRMTLQPFGSVFDKEERARMLANVLRDWDQLMGWDLDQTELAEAEWLLKWIETGHAFNY